MLNHYKCIDLALFACYSCYSYNRNRESVGGGMHGNTIQEIIDKLEKSREHAAQGMYKDATEVSRDMRAKYGL